MEPRATLRRQFPKLFSEFYQIELSRGCYVLAADSEGEQSGLLTHIATTEKRLVVGADEKLTAFLELESAIGQLSEVSLSGAL